MVKVTAYWKKSLIAMTLVGSAIPQSAIQAEQQRVMLNRSVKQLADNSTLDIQLGKDGAFSGRVVDHAGVAVKSTPVTIKQGRTTVLETVTNDRGEFSAANLKNGTYEVSSGSTSGAFRVWSEKTAPPSAKPQGLLVMGENGARGQVGAMDGTTMLLTAIAVGGLVTGITGIVIANDAKKKADQALNTAPSSP